tara:strand:+ start:299 stop:520 length:222 start_codon:yes stop_codon:yes gene_type:complete
MEKLETIKEKLEMINDRNIAFTVHALILGKDIVGDNFTNIPAIKNVFGLTQKQAKFCLELATSINKEDYEKIF